MEELKNTPLLPQHRDLKAQLAPFGGWLMPIQYEGILAEHRACRERAALFDVSHMGEFLFRGDFAAEGFNDVFSFPAHKIPVGRSRYGFLLNESGGIIDDLIVFRLAEDEAMVVVNAATTEKDFATIRSRLRPGSDFTDISQPTGKIDLQGPLARQILVDTFGDQFASLPFFRFVKAELLGVEAIVSRTGYTGELGYEIFIPANRVGALWELWSSDPRVAPAGLGARDLLRLEMGYSLYGNDIDESTSPLAAGLASFVDFGGAFVGKAALLEEQQRGVSRVKVAFRVNSRRAPRHDYAIEVPGREAGKVTSGAFSPMLGCGIGLGFVTPEAAELGSVLTIKHERVEMEGTVVELPFYRDGSLRA